MKRTAVVGAVVIAVLASGCQSPEPVEDIVVDPPGTRDLSSYRAQEVVWSQCDSDWYLDSDYQSETFLDADVRCTWIDVPAVYEEGGIDKDFSIALMRVSSDGWRDSSGKAIFINPGGPGGSGIEQVQNSDFPEELLDEYAFIGFDPRGVGKSTFSDGTEIRCSDELDYVSYFGEATPASEEEWDALVEQSDEYYLDCASRNPLWWTLSTESVTRDLDLLRQLITPGQPLNFIGSSYGTTIAGRYVSLYPATVGKIVFDSPTTVDTDRIRSTVVGWEADEKKLAGYVQGYADFLGVSFDEAWERVLEVRRRGDADQLIGYAGFEPSPVEPDYMVSSEGLFTNGIFALNYIPEDEAQELFNSSMEEAYEYNWNGTFESLAFWLDGYEPDSLEGPTLAAKPIERSNEYEIRVIVNTMDYGMPPLEEDAQRQLSAELKEVAPLSWALYSDESGYEYFGPEKGIDWLSLALEDDSIPDPPSTPFVPSNPSGKQLLIVGSLYESVTPFSFAKDTATLLDSTLITVESEVHAPAAWYDNECLNEVLVSYFLGDQPVSAKTCRG